MGLSKVPVISEVSLFQGFNCGKNRKEFSFQAFEKGW